MVKIYDGGEWAEAQNRIAALESARASDAARIADLEAMLRETGEMLEWVGGFSWVGDHLFFGRRGPFCQVCFGEWVLEHLDTMEPTP